MNAKQPDDNGAAAKQQVSKEAQLSLHNSKHVL
jgi:hypothetical protein